MYRCQKLCIIRLSSITAARMGSSKVVDGSKMSPYSISTTKQQHSRNLCWICLMQARREADYSQIYAPVRRMPSQCMLADTPTCGYCESACWSGSQVGLRGDVPCDREKIPAEGKLTLEPASGADRRSQELSTKVMRARQVFSGNVCRGSSIIWGLSPSIDSESLGTTC